MNPLIQRLADLRRRLRWVTTVRGLLATVSVLLGGMMLAGILDWRLQLPVLIRAFLLVSILVSLGYLTYQKLLAPLATPADDLSLALRVESHYPVLNDSLASTIEFLRQPSDSETAGSPSLRRVAVQQAMRMSEDCDFRKVVSTHGMGFQMLAVVSLLLVACLCLIYYPAHASTSARRLLLPFGGHNWTVLEMPEHPHRIAQGQPFAIRGKVKGVVIPEVVTIELDGMLSGTESVEVRDGEWIYPLDMTQQQGKFRFRIRANDASYPSRRNSWHDVAIVPPPKWTLLNDLPSPQIELYFPNYTDLPSPERLTPGNRHVAAVQGTKVRLRAATDRPLAKAWLEYQFDQVNPAIPQGLMLGALGASHCLGATSSLASGHSVWGQFPAKLSADRKLITLDFWPHFSGEYRLWLEDDEGLKEDYFGDLLIQRDPIPHVTLNAPSHNQDVLPGADITLDVLARDDQFGLRSVYVELRRKNEHGQWLDAEPRKLFLYRETPLFDALHLASIPLLPSFHLRRPDYHGTYSYSIAGLTEPGESLVVQAFADDFNTVVPNNPPGRSHAVELRIVDRSKLDRIVERTMQKMHKQLIDLKKTQEKALAIVKEVKNQLGQDDEGNHDKLAEAKELQKQMQRRVGATPEEGLRAEIKRLRDTLRQNKLPPSAASDRLRTLEHELGRITQEDLQRIEPTLAEAMKDINLGKKIDKLQSLEQAQELQQDARRSLDELIKFLDPWAEVSDAKVKAGDLLDEQKELRKQTEELKLLKEEMENKDLPAEKRKQAQEKFEKGLNRTIGAQKNLAEKAEDLLNMIDNMAKRLEKEKPDDPTLELLQEAREEGRKKSLLADKMRQSALDLSNRPVNPNRPGEKNSPDPLLNEALQGQRQAEEALERLIEALEEDRDEEVARLMKKQQQQERVLGELADQVDQLRQKVNAASNDPEKLKMLAEEQRQLQEKVKKKARELARLQADESSRALSRAAQKMEQAAKQLDRGLNPEQAQKDAKEDIEDAKKKLAEAEQRLAREQLARIADRLKGFKKRQDAAIAESKRLHHEVTVELQRWTSQHQRSLLNLADDQVGLSREMLSLEEMLEGAEVFVHLLKQSAESMKKASKIIREERVAKVAFRLRGFEPEELLDEEQTQRRTLREQTRAARKLEHLIEALKNAKPRKRRARKQEGKQGPKQPNEGENNLQGPGDRLPSIAQLKVLREEQADIYQRTQSVRSEQRESVIAGAGVIAGVILPSTVAPMTDDQRQRLERIRTDQQDIRQLFEGIVSKQNEAEEE